MHLFPHLSHDQILIHFEDLSHDGFLLVFIFLNFADQLGLLIQNVDIGVGYLVF